MWVPFSSCRTSCPHLHGTFTLTPSLREAMTSRLALNGRQAGKHSLMAELSKKDQTMKNNLMFMAVDKIDKVTAAAILIQARVRGAAARGSTAKDRTVLNQATKNGLEALKDNPIDFAGKADRQLSRVEFMNALVKTAQEKYVRSRQNVNNELDHVSDGLEKLFCEIIEPALQVPPLGRTQPRIPLPDDFRNAVCYVEEVSDALAHLAPTLRVLFAGLAKLSYEAGKGSAESLPRIGKSKQVRRAGNVTWTVVQGLMSFFYWRAFIHALQLTGPDQRSVGLCFIYSIMCSIDGSIRARHLPFEGFLEALVRFATIVPLPTDVQLNQSGHRYAGTLISQMETGDAETLARFSGEQKCEWGGVPDAAIGGAMHRRIHHLLDIVVRRIKEPKEPDAPVGILTRRDFRFWALRNLPCNAGVSLPEAWVFEVETGESA